MKIFLRKIVAVLICISFVLTSGMADIISYAQTVDVDSLYQVAKSIVSDFVVEEGVLKRYKGNQKIVDIPKEVEYIGEGAFEGNKNIEEVKLPKNVESISKNAFKDCENLKKIALNEKLIFIEDNAFEGCKNLETITIPENIETLEKGVFKNCKSLKNIIILNKNLKLDFSEFKDLKDISFYADNDEVVELNDKNEIKGLKEGTSEIAVFANESDLTYGDFTYTVSNSEVTITGYTGRASSVTVPVQIEGMNVVSIGSNAFENCVSLEVIKLPDSITGIESGAFYGCTNLKEVTLPSQLKTMGGGVFNSEYITYIKIPKTVEVMGHSSILGLSSPFNECKKLEKVEFEEGMEEIPKYALADCSVKEVIIPNSVTNIGDSAFEGCKSLGKVELPNKLKSIGGSAFKNCVLFENIKLPDSIIEIWDGAFYGCTNLKEVTLPSQLKTMGSGIFNSEYITYIKIPKTVEGMGHSSVLGLSSPFNECKKLEKVEFEEGMEEIPKYALADCSVKEVIIPNSVTNIGESAFEGCKNFTIYGVRGSYAQTYANLNNIPFMDINDKILIDKLNLDHLISNISMEGDSISASIEVLGKDVDIFDVKTGVKIPLADNASVSVDSNTKTIKVLLGFKDFSGNAEISPDGQSSAYWSESYREVKALYKGMTGRDVHTTKLWNDFSKLRGKLKKSNGSMVIDGKIYLAGYIEFSYETGNPVFSEGGLILETQLGATTDFRWAPPYSAIYTTAGINAGLKGDFTLTNTTSRKIQIAAVVEPSLTLMGGIGLGSKKANWYAEGSVSGTIDTTLNFPMSSLEESMTATLTGEARLKLVAAGHNLTEKARYEFPGIQLYPKTSKNTLFKIAKPSQYELNNAKPISRDYLTSNKTRLKSVSSNKTSFIKTNLYPYNEPELINLGNGKVMLIWVDDNGQKSDLNRTSLMYSIYDGSSWSEAKEIDETGTYNDRADVYVYDGKAYILWSKANKEWTESMTLSQKLATLDLYYTVYDGESFTNPVKVNDDSNSIYEMDYSIAATDNKVLVTWTENSENDIFNENGTKSFYCKEFINNVAGEKTIVETNSEGFTEIDSGYIGTNKVIAYSYTNGSDSNQGTDITINYNGNKNIISNESSNNYEIRIKDDKLYYLNNSKLVEYDIANQTSQDIIDGLNDYDILSNGDNKAIISIKPKEEGFDLQAKYYNSSNNTWGEWIDITNYNKYIRKYSLIMSDTGKITAALSLADMLDSGTQPEEAFGSSTLLVTDLDSSFDLEIGKDVYYDYDEIVPNGKVNFNFNVRNNSQKQLDSIKVTILDENDKELQSSNVICNLEAGETKEIKYEYYLPSEIKYQPIKIKVSSEFDEINLDNNIVETAIGYADVEIKNEKTIYKDNILKIAADINNIGYSDAKGVKINVYKTNASGELLDTINVGDLKPGDSKTITYEIPESVSSSEDIEDAIYLEVIAENTEATLSNNFARVLFKIKNNTSLKVIFNPNNGENHIEKEITKDTILDYTPQIPVKNGYVFVGWFKDVDDITTKYKSDSTYTEDVTYTAKYAHVNMLGAQVKAVVDNKSGIRFGTRIYDDGDEIVEKGTLILPANLLADGEALTLETPKAARSVGKVNYEVNEEKNYITYLGTLINISDSQFDTNITASSYVIYKDKSGNEYTVYSPYKNGSTTINKLLGVVK